MNPPPAASFVSARYPPALAPILKFVASRGDAAVPALSTPAAVCAGRLSRFEAKTTIRAPAFSVHAGIGHLPKFADSSVRYHPPRFTAAPLEFVISSQSS